jgi:hypothetical protein
MNGHCARVVSGPLRTKSKRMATIHLLLFTAIGIQPLAVHAKEQRIQNVTGYGEDETLAIRQALRDAVARACGERISSTLDLNSLSSNSKSLSNNGRDDRSFSSSNETSSNISTTTDGVVSRYDLIKSQRDEAGNRHAVTLDVVVGQCLVEVDVNSLNNQMAQVLSEIVKVGQTGGLISDPNTYAEFYHNARILQQRGEIDLAMQAYEQALSEGYLFVDPLLDLLDLANARYGEDGTKIYFEDRIKNRIPKQLSDIGELALNDDIVTLVQPILDDKLNFSPLLVSWLQSSYINWDEMDTLTVGKARTKAVELISRDYKSGKLQSFFIDKIRGAAIGQSAIQEYKSWTPSTQFSLDRDTVSRASVRFERIGMIDRMGVIDSTPYIGQIQIQDRVNLTQPITLCAKVYGGQLTCRNLDHGRNAYKDSSGYGYHSGTEGYDVNTRAYFPSMLNWTFGMHCAVSVSYTDLLGFKVTSPVLVGHENREEYAPKDLDKIIKCAGDHYRPRG